MRARRLNLFGKCLAQLLSVTFAGENACVTVYPYVMVIGIVLCAIGSVRILQLLVRRHEALLGVPLYQCAFMIQLVILGFIFFGEFAALSILDIGLFSLAIAIAIAGVALIAQRPLPVAVPVPVEEPIANDDDVDINAPAAVAENDMNEAPVLVRELESEPNAPAPLPELELEAPQMQLELERQQAASVQFESIARIRMDSKSNINIRIQIDSNVHAIETSGNLFPVNSVAASHSAVPVNVLDFQDLQLVRMSVENSHYSKNHVNKFKLSSSLSIIKPAPVPMQTYNFKKNQVERELFSQFSTCRQRSIRVFNLI